MSTRSSIAYGDNFHLYQEGFDDENIYLELEKTEFEACSQRVMVAIPIEVWEYIRSYSFADYSLIDMSDEEILASAEEEVERRITRYENAPTPAEAKSVLALEFIGFEEINLPRQLQIDSRVEELTQARNQQRELKRKIEQIRQVD